ncbi:MAG: protease inhibitor I42 family protein [Actinobacteria bacterium]|nr:protease inhibitor I42 family protein [Actinomycetota bacterium]
MVTAVLTLSLGGCTAGGGAEYRDPSVPIVVEKGEEFTIALESNPSTGYRWRLGGDLDEKVVTLQKVEFEEPEAERLGQPGEEKWTFKAEGLGRAEIVMTYARPWEGDAGAATVGALTLQAGEEAEAGEAGESREESETTRATEREEAEVREDNVEQEGAEEAGPQTLVFSVWVKEKGAKDKEPKKYEDPAETVEVKEGYRFSVVLESDPTAGEHWELQEPIDEELLSLVSVTFEAKGGGHAEGGENSGAPGEETWTFEALRPGEAELVFAYRHLGEREAAPGETRTFKVEVMAVEGEASSGH